jgi:hypothetical protein
MFPIAEDGPVEEGIKAVVPVVIATRWAGVATGRAICGRNRVSIVEADRNVPLSFTLPAMNDPNARQFVPIAWNIKTLCVSEGGRQEK